MVNTDQEDVHRSVIWILNRPRVLLFLREVQSDGVGFGIKSMLQVEDVIACTQHGNEKHSHYRKYNSAHAFLLSPCGTEAHATRAKVILTWTV